MVIASNFSHLNDNFADSVGYSYMLFLLMLPIAVPKARLAADTTATTDSCSRQTTPKTAVK